MSSYQLPRTESGEVDWEKIAGDVYQSMECVIDTDWAEILKAIDVNARAEEWERIIGIVQNIKPTLDANKYQSDSERHLLKVSEAGMRGLIVDAIMEDGT